MMAAPTHNAAVEASHALRSAAQDLTAACIHLMAQQDAPELHEPVSAAMMGLLRKIDDKTR